MESNMAQFTSLLSHFLGDAEIVFTVKINHSVPLNPPAIQQAPVSVSQAVNTSLPLPEFFEQLIKPMAAAKGQKLINTTTSPPVSDFFGQFKKPTAVAKEQEVINTTSSSQLAEFSEHLKTPIAIAKKQELVGLDEENRIAKLTEEIGDFCMTQMLQAQNKSDETIPNQLKRKREEDDNESSEIKEQKKKQRFDRFSRQNSNERSEKGGEHIQDNLVNKTFIPVCRACQSNNHITDNCIFSKPCKLCKKYNYKHNPYHPSNKHDAYHCFNRCTFEQCEKELQKDNSKFHDKHYHYRS
jgi:hypothetical protein